MKTRLITMCVIFILTCGLLAGCGGGTQTIVVTPTDPGTGGTGTGGTGGTSGTGQTTTKSGDGTYTGGGSYELSDIKIIGPNVKFPTKFTYMGGDIQITATVTSTEKIDYVKAVVTPPGGTAEDVPMSGPTPYKCTYKLKANLKMGGPAAQYTIKVVAANQAGKYAETAVGKLDISPPSSLPPDRPF